MPGADQRDGRVVHHLRGLHLGRVDAGNTSSGDYAKAMLVATTAVATTTWLAVTFLTQPESDAVLDRFLPSASTGGPGWRRVARRLGYGHGSPGGALSWVNWAAGVAAVYSSCLASASF